MCYLAQCDSVHSLYVYTRNVRGSPLLMGNAENIPLSPASGMPGLAGCWWPCGGQANRCEDADSIPHAPVPETDSACPRWLALKKQKSEHLSPRVVEHEDYWLPQPHPHHPSCYNCTSTALMDKSLHPFTTHETSRSGPVEANNNNNNNVCSTCVLIKVPKFVTMFFFPYPK